MIAVTVAATVTCPLAFLGYCRNSKFADTVHSAGTYQWLVLILNSNRDCYFCPDCWVRMLLDTVQIMPTVGILGILEWISWFMID